MRFHFVWFGWWALPVAIVWGLVVLLAYVLWAAAVVAAWLLVRVFGPLLGAGTVALLGRLDQRVVDRLETAEERHENGREKRQEVNAYAELYGRHPGLFR